MKMALWTTSSATTNTTKPSPTRQYRLFHQRDRRSEPVVVIDVRPAEGGVCLDGSLRANCWESMAIATKGLTRTTTALGAAVCAVGALVVLAWVMHWELVLRVHP